MTYNQDATYFRDFFVKLTVRHAYSFTEYTKSHMRVSPDPGEIFETQWVTGRVGGVTYNRGNTVPTKSEAFFFTTSSPPQTLGTQG